MTSKWLWLAAGFSLVSIGNLGAQALFPKPVKVLGDPQYIGTRSQPTQFSNNGPNWVEGREFSFPNGIALDTSVSPPNLYVADYGNNRVFGYRYATQQKPGALADVVLGQIDRFTNLPQGPGGRATGFNLPSGLACDAAGNLYVADTGNNRVLRFPQPLAQPAGLQFPDLVIGQTSLNGKSANGGLSVPSATSLSLNTGSVSRAGIAIDANGNLWVTDTGNNRVLRYPVSVLQGGQNGPAADLVLGQADFVSRVAATVRTSKTTLAGPQALSFDGAGRLLVADSAARVLVYPAGVASNGVALRILGVDTTSPTQIGIGTAFGVAGSAAGVVVADTSANRVMVFPSVDSWPAEATQFSPSATEVIGQAAYTDFKTNRGNGEASASSLNAPTDVALAGSELYVADAQNNRVLVYPAAASGISSSAVRVIGQLDFPYNTTNLIEGKEFSFALTGSPSPALPTGFAVLDQSVSPPHLYVADVSNHRILGFKDFTHLQNGQAADLVIGQPDLFRSVANYPTGDSTKPNAQGLRFPSSLAVDSAGNLFVADTGNSRILRFPAPFASGKTSLESADLVLGQSNFTSSVTDPTDRTMASPISIALSVDGANASSANSGWLIAVDNAHNRVLFFPKPFTSGESATKVLGSLNFTSVTGGSADPPRFNTPHGVTVDPNDRVIVADSGNHRIQIFNKVSQINNYDTPPTSLASGFNQPVSVTAGANGFWVADPAIGGLVHFPPVDQLPLKNNAADAVLSAVQPMSAFVDGFNNLLISDFICRVLYYAPQINTISAANYSSRPVTGGEIVSLFPNLAANTIAGGTESFTTTPLPTTLADTQVLVNGTAAPLFFASPGQINMQLPNGLPTGGTADLQVIRPSTGQIYGGSELSLATTSPGFFTANATGIGQIAAINVQDGTINSALNPVARGQYITLYGTGLGPLAGAPPDGSLPNGVVSGPNPQVLIGAASKGFIPDANIQYSGLAPTLVGVWQLNIQIPSDATTGSSVPIKVFVNSVPSIDPGSSATNTIAIK